MACFNYGQVDTATERMGRSFEVLSRDEPDADLATLAGQLARFRYLLDDLDGAIEPLEFALEIAEALMLPSVISDALNTKGLIVAQRGRREEGLGLMRHALEIALESDLTESGLRAYFNLAYLTACRDWIEEAVAIDEKGLDLARRRGSRLWEESFRGHLRTDRFFLGEWDRFDYPPLEELRDDGWDALPWSLRLDYAGLTVPIHVARGRLQEARDILANVPSEQRAEAQERASVAVGQAALARGEGRHEAALELTEETCSLRGNGRVRSSPLQGSSCGRPGLCARPG